MNLEVHVIAVSDVERAKSFYQQLGWRLDEDVAPATDVRIVQFTPPGSACSVTFRQRSNRIVAWLGRGGANCPRHQSGSFRTHPPWHRGE